MRKTFSYTGILSVSMLATFTSFASNSHLTSPAGSRNVSYGLADTQHIDSASKKPFYVQAGTFKNVNNATIFKKQLTKRNCSPLNN